MATEERELIKQEMLSRVTSFFGEESAGRLNNAFVIVVGLGGVGSHVSNMLVRSGVQRIRLIDFDQVSLSSLNRHACATMDDVGRSKASVLKTCLHKVLPWSDIEAVSEMFHGADAERLLSGNPDYVIDCIDDINTKAELIAYCLKNNLKLLVSLGAGGKADPTRLRIAPLSDCINDPLASKIKWKLKKHSISPEDVMSVFSIEKPICNLLPLDEDQKANPQDFGVVDYIRLRVMPVLGTSPSIFGQAMASYVLCSLAGQQYAPEACERLSKNLKHKLREMLKRNEAQRCGSIQNPETIADFNIDEDDIEFIVQQVWQGRCCVTAKRFGGHAPLVLTRWNAMLPVSPHNMVLMIQTSADLLLKAANVGPDGLPICFPADVTQKISARLTWAKALCSDELIYSTCGLHNASLAPSAMDPSRYEVFGDPVEAFLDKRVRDSFAETVVALTAIFLIGYFVGRRG